MKSQNPLSGAQESLLSVHVFNVSPTTFEVIYAVMKTNTIVNILK